MAKKRRRGRWQCAAIYELDIFFSIVPTHCILRSYVCAVNPYGRGILGEYKVFLTIHMPYASIYIYAHTCSNLCSGRAHRAAAFRARKVKLSRVGI